MYRLVYSAIVLIFFSLSAHAQTMNNKDIADAIITAVEYNNEFKRRIFATRRAG